MIAKVKYHYYLIDILLNVKSFLKQIIVYNYYWINNYSVLLISLLIWK